MKYSKYIFIGDTNEPFYMIELNKTNHSIMIFKPDKYSKKLNDFFEKYYLGEILYEINYEKIIFIKNDIKEFDKIKDLNASILSEILIKIKNDKYLLIKNDIQTNYKL
jgi:hypothetical protein